MAGMQILGRVKCQGKEGRNYLKEWSKEAKKSTRIEFYKVLEHPERGRGVDGDGGRVLHGYIAADLVPDALMLDNVRLPGP